MTSELIIIKDYCLLSNIEMEFVLQLVDEGLIEITTIENIPHMHISQLKNVEQYARWYYDLSINVAGIDMIQNLLDQMDAMRTEIKSLRQQIRLARWDEDDIL